MKKKIILFSVFTAMILTGALGIRAAASQAAKPSPLRVKGTRIVNASGKTITLKGVSTHGIAWYPQYVNKSCFQSFKKMGANTVRLAFYSDDAAGYSKSLYKKVEEGIQAATDLGM